MSFCTMCGSKLDDNAAACSVCGSVVENFDSRPVYEATQPAYEAPQPAYEAPQPAYAAPQPAYQPAYAAPQPTYEAQRPQEVPVQSDLAKAAKILMIITTVILGLYIIPLAWCIPMIIIYNNRLKKGEPIGVGFSIACMFLVSGTAGILMLVDDELKKRHG